MKETYHIGQNFCRIKLFAGQNFRHLRKVSSLLSYGISSLLSTFVRKFCPFSKFEITLKNSIRYFFRDYSFFTIRIKKTFTYSTFQQLCSTRSHCPQSTVAFFSFSLSARSLLNSLPRHPHHPNHAFAVAFFFFWFHYLTILIILYYDSNCFFVLNLCFIVVLRLKFPGVKLSKKVLDFLVC